MAIRPTAAGLLAVAFALGSSTSLGSAAMSQRSAPAKASQATVAAGAKYFPPPPLKARAAVVLDATNGNVLYSVNPHLRLPMASTTKIMTALLALEMGKLSDRITVPAEAFNYESDATVMGLRPGQVVTLQDLLYGLLLSSGADAANTIAIHYAGSEARFVAMMNHEAALLGLVDTHYVDATGLSSNNHFSSAYDLAVLGQYVSYLPQIESITSAKSYMWDGHTLQNINRVLFWYPGVDGVKPGFTDAAGICQVLDARRDGEHVTVAVLNTPNLVTDARNLLNFGLKDFSWIQSPLAGDKPSDVEAGTDAKGAFDYFAASGHYVRAPFLGAFKRLGGLGVLGFPRTEPLNLDGASIQYFQNAALALRPPSGKVQRVSLGAGVLPLTQAKAHLGEEPQAATPAPTATSAASTVTVASAFRPYVQKAHWIGAPLANAASINGHLVQVFNYGALSWSAGRVTLLPIGDRYLSLRGYLPTRPGNAYPAGFASTQLLKALFWI